MIRFFKIAGSLEALSYLVLLLVAMPLKYIWHMPVYVRWTGSFHGAFFLLFCVAIVRVSRERQWPLRRSALAFGSAFLPFGPIVFERYYLED